MTGVVVSGSGKMTPGTSVEGEASCGLDVLKQLKHSLSLLVVTLAVLPDAIPIIIYEGMCIRAWLEVFQDRH